MTIFFDLTNLGWGHLNPAEQTGIYRSTLELAKALVQQDFSGELRWFSSGTMAPWVQRAVASDPQLSHRSVQVNPGLLWQRLGSMTTNVTPVSGGLLPKMWQIPWWLETTHGQSLATLRKETGSASLGVFHSPIYPLPRFNRRSRPTLRRVLTVHDLAFLDMPETCTANTCYRMKTTMAAVAPEDTVIAISQFTKDRCCERLGWNPEQIQVIPWAASEPFHAIQTPRERPIEPWGLQPYHYFMTVGTVEPRKNLGLAVEAFGRFWHTLSLEQRQVWKLVMVGPKGWKMSGFEGTIPPALQEAVVMTGQISDGTLATLYQHARGLLFPSWYEGFGLPLVEAMACGCPVLSSDRAAMPEVLGLDGAGLLLPPDAVTPWRDAMESLVEEPSVFVAMKTAALQQSQQFSWAQTAQKTWAVYQAALRTG